MFHDITKYKLKDEWILWQFFYMYTEKSALVLVMQFLNVDAECARKFKRVLWELWKRGWNYTTTTLIAPWCFSPYAVFSLCLLVGDFFHYLTFSVLFISIPCYSDKVASSCARNRSRNRYIGLRGKPYHPLVSQRQRLASHLEIVDVKYFVVRINKKEEGWRSITIGSGGWESSTSSNAIRLSILKLIICTYL